MAKRTHRYDTSFTIPLDATFLTTMSKFEQALSVLHSNADGADVDWANLEVRSERYQQEFLSMADQWKQNIEEYTLVTMTVRGRK